VEAGPSARRFAPGIAVTLCGIAPFAIAGLAWKSDGGELAGAGLIGGCPMLETFGIPCAGCGAARAFFHLTHGDGAFLDFNPFWPLVAAIAVGYGMLLLGRAARGEPTFGPHAQALRSRFATQPVRMAALTLAVLLTPWLIALANADAIRSA
jgi:hypothetical protein